MKTKLLAIGMVLTLTLLFITFIGRPDKSPDSSQLTNSMDDLGQIPEWLIMNADEAFPLEDLNIWVPTNNFHTSSLIRVPRFPRKFLKSELEKNKALYDFTIIPHDPDQVLELTAVINEQVSAQLAFGAKKDIHDVRITVSELVGEQNNSIDSEAVQVRYVKYVPIERSRSEYVWSPKLETIVGEGTSGSMAPNVVGDPLVSTDKVDVPSYRAQAVWFTFKVPKDTNPGIYSGFIEMTSKEFGSVSCPFELKILDKKIPNPINYKFELDLWLNASVIADYYKLEHWSDAHWKMIEKYLKEYASIGGKNITTTITHEPWRKPWINNTIRSQISFGYKSMVQWSKNLDGDWEFDYSVFDRYVEMSTKAGIRGAVHAFSMTPFKTDQEIQYHDKSDNRRKTISVGVFDKEYQEIWSDFLVSFKRHLIEKGLFDRVYLAIDEKPQEVLEVLYRIIKGSAPEFFDKIVIAGHPEIGENAKNLSISYMFFPNQPLEKHAVVPVLPTIEDRKKQNKLTTFYLCAEPAHPNTMTYSPAIEGQVIPWLALKYNTDGYLRWAFNNWTEDPFKKPVFIHAQGDDYLIYPGEDGPVSSIRWELLKEGIEDYELFRVIRKEGDIADEDLERAIELATRNSDGRTKNAADFQLVREILTQKR